MDEYFHPKFSNHQQFKVEPESGILTVRLFVDRNSLEIFHQKGKVVSTQLMYPINDDFKWVLKANNLEAELKNVSLYKHQ